jgi:hypothetical protein
MRKILFSFLSVYRDVSGMERLHYSIIDPMSIPVDYFDLNLETLRMDHERDEVRESRREVFVVFV